MYNQDLWKISEEDGQVVSAILSIRKIPCNSIQPGGGGGGCLGDIGWILEMVF